MSNLDIKILSNKSLSSLHRLISALRAEVGSVGYDGDIDDNKAPINHDVRCLSITAPQGCEGR